MEEEGGSDGREGGSDWKRVVVAVEAMGGEVEAMG